MKDPHLWTTDPPKLEHPDPPYSRWFCPHCGRENADKGGRPLVCAYCGKFKDKPGG